MSAITIGYARCSTDKQDLAAQRAALERLGVPPERIYTDHGLTGTNRARPGLDQALAAVRAGDTLVVPKLDRLARSVPDARAIADELVARGVKLALGSSVYDPADPLGKMFFNILATFAEFEADLIRLGERLEKDMIALAVGPPLRVAVVAAPDYLRDHPAPMEPADLTAHRCVAYGDAHGDLSPWSFERDGHAVTVKPGSGPVFNDGDLLVAAALEGFGILYILEDLVAAPIGDGRLIRLLEPWCEPFAGYHLYYPDRRGTTAFELFKEALQASRVV